MFHPQTINNFDTGAKRYLEGQALWDKKYSRQVKKVARHREKNLRLAKEDTNKVMDKLHNRLVREHRASSTASTPEAPGTPSEFSGDKGDISLNSPLWHWSWALEGERPPPSSIVARRDTVSRDSLLGSV